MRSSRFPPNSFFLTELVVVADLICFNVISYVLKIAVEQAVLSKTAACKTCDIFRVVFQVLGPHGDCDIHFCEECHVVLAEFRLHC